MTRPAGTRGSQKPSRTTNGRATPLRCGQAIVAGWAPRALLVAGVLLIVLTGRPWSPPALDLASEYALAQGVPPVQATSPAAPTDTATPTSSATTTGVPAPTATALTTVPPASPTATTAANTPIGATTAASAPTSTTTSTVQAAPTPTGTPQPTPTPLPASVLPPLAPTPDLPGVTVTATIGSTGGRVSSADGRVTVDVPAGVFPTAVNVTVTRKDHHLLGAPWPDSPLVGAWQFDATTVQGGAPLHTFPSNVTVSVRFGGGDLIGRNPATLAFWTWDDLNRQWVSVPAALDATQQTMTASLNHFSVYSASVDNLVDAAPLLDGHNVGVQGGTADLSIPIEVPPGPGGLTPDLALSYDSGRLWEMRTYSTAASWAGMGWELSTGSIQLSTSSDGLHVRAFLDLNGLSGELMPDGTYDATTVPATTVWRLRDEQYARVRTDCALSWGAVSNPCTWWVTDKQGRKYTFGADTIPLYATNTPLRWVWQCMPSLLGGGCYWAQTFYRFDLASVTDRLGNSINYTYAQQISSSQADCINPSTGHADCSYVIASYPTGVTYGSGSITFEVGCDTLFPSGACGREDAPQSLPAFIDSNGNNCPAYQAPPVVETRRLTAINVYGASGLIRRYELGHSHTPFYRAPYLFQSPAASCSPYVGYINTCASTDQYGHCASAALCPSAATGCTYEGGTDILNSLTIKGADSSSVLSTMAFYYANLQTTHSSSSGSWYYNYPHLTQADNGFGGSVLFDYTQIGDREVVHHETHRSGLGEPDVVTTYDYTAGGAEQAYPDPYVQPSPGAPTNGYDIFNAAYRGFGQVTETDGAGVQTVHSYDTTGTYCCTNGQTTPASWQNEILTGREYQTVVKGSDTTVWKTVATTFQTVAIPNTYYPYTNVGNTGQSFINFVAPLQVATTLKDGSSSYVQNIYDATSSAPPATPAGLLVEQDQFLGAIPTPGQATACPGGSCMLRTTTAYAYDATDWIFVPQYEAQTDPQNSNALLSCARSYYDGATSAGTLVSGTAKGLQTAQSTAITATACDATTAFTTSTNSYSVFDAYGNAVQSSVATATPPEGRSNSNSLGWIPSGVATTTTTYDSTYHVYPTGVTNPLGQQATTTYTFPYGKPDTVTEPTGHATKYQYDTFGRLTQVFDNYDPNNPGTPLASPTTAVARFTYNWGGVPNRTLSEQFTGTSTTRSSITCMDGFGRTVEQRQSYLDTAFGTILSSVRTDYDAVGRRAVQTNPVASNSSVACGSSPAPTSARDRTAFAYDPLGNVATTTYLAANQTSGPSTQTIVNGLTTTTIDENGHKTDQYSWRTWRLRIVTQYTGTGTTSDPYAAYATTAYKDDALGRLVTVQDPRSNQTTISYDLAGRKTSMHDPDMGNWTYGYAAAGNLTSQTDARNITTTLNYDALNRLVQKTYSNGDPGAMLAYDCYPNVNPCPATGTAIGHLTQSAVGVPPQLPGPSSNGVFDLRGRELTANTIVDGQTYPIGRTYNLLSGVTTTTLPDNETVSATYSPNTGAPTKLTSSLGDTLVSQAAATPWGAPAALALGNGLTARYTYDSRQRLTGITTGTALVPGSAQNMALTYDDASNVKAVTDRSTGEVDGYAYDALDRLTSMTVNGIGAASYSYDTIGNMTAKTESLVGMLNPTNMTLTYPASGSASVRPHAVTSTAGTPALTLTYDAAGNLASTSASSSTYTFDAENRLKTRTVSGGTVSYTYDANGTLVKRTNADNTWTVYVGGVFEKNSDGNTVKYYGASGKVVAMRKTPSGGAPSLYYLLGDHLGSTSVITDASGAVVASEKYWPYGATRSGAITQTDKLYTGQQAEPGDSALGLSNYKARFYSSVTGRFVSADSVTVDGLNRYAYVRNNPVNHTDPTGRCFRGPDGTELPCDPGAVNTWLACALGACANRPDLELMAQVGIGQALFWANAYDLSRRYSGGGVVYTAGLLVTIGKYATINNFNLIPASGFTTLGVMLGMGGLKYGPFVRASLSDLLFGTRDVSQLSAGEIAGGTLWWEVMGSTMDILGGLGHNQARNSVDVMQEFDDRTLDVASQLDPVDIAHAFQWSEDQWTLLHWKFGIPIPPPPEDPSQGECDVQCIVDWINSWHG
jgi:RHS repeat-associated protein